MNAMLNPAHGAILKSDLKLDSAWSVLCFSSIPVRSHLFTFP